MEGTPCRTVLALDTTSLIETKIIRAVRDRESTVVGVLVGPGEDHDIDYDVIDTANQLSMHLGIAPPGHWRLTGEHGRPEFYPATRPRLHDWRDFLTGLGVRLDDDGAWKAISDPGLRPGREPGTGSQRLRCLAPGGVSEGPGQIG